LTKGNLNFTIIPRFGFYLAGLFGGTMFRRIKSKSIALGLILAFLMFGSPYLLQSQSKDTGSIKGLIFAKDGTTPYPGAVVTVKNVTTGQEYQSKATDSQGAFLIEGLPKGVYVFGVSTPEGTFNSDNLIGVEPGKTSKISIALTMFDAKTKAAAHEIYKDQSKSGEALVGKVVGFSSASKIAQVFILRGFVKIDDRLRVTGPATNFHQDLKVLKLGDTDVKQAYAGQTAFIQFEYNAIPDDLVYVICKKGGFPLFLMPLGIAAIVAGVGAITPTVECDPCNEVSTFRKKK
jgi:hypothetical protein